MEKRTIGILFGGASSEHDVSLMSATSVLENIDREKYDVIMVGITRDGRWMRYTGDVKKLIDHSWEEDSGNLPAFLSPDRSVHGLVTVRDGQMEITPSGRRIPGDARTLCGGRFHAGPLRPGRYPLCGPRCLLQRHLHG